MSDLPGVDSSSIQLQNAQECRFPGSLTPRLLKRGVILETDVLGQIVRHFAFDTQRQSLITFEPPRIPSRSESRGWRVCRALGLLLP